MCTETQWSWSTFEKDDFKYTLEEIKKLEADIAKNRSKEDVTIMGIIKLEE